MDNNDLSWRTLVGDIDLTTDEAWTPVFSPYHGRMMPAWAITQAARWRMGYDQERKR